MFKFISEYKKLRYLAYHDALTGVLNRNWLYEYTDKIFKDFVYFIDINDLKLVNEKGHTHGDLHIKSVVRILEGKLSNDDMLIRYAGDEFIVFSDTNNLLETNNVYSVGCSKITKIRGVDVMRSIRKADTNMIKNKKNWKL